MNVSPELDSLFRAAALREGLVDVRYDIVDTPIGNLLIAILPGARILDRVSKRVIGIISERLCNCRCQQENDKPVRQDFLFLV